MRASRGMTLGRFAENSAQFALTGGVDTTVYEDDLVALKMQDKYRFFWTSADDFEQADLVTFDESNTKLTRLQKNYLSSLLLLVLVRRLPGAFQAVRELSHAWNPNF